MAGWPWLAASAALAVCALLPITQQEQHLRWRAEKMLHAGDIAAALEFMSRHEQTQFPPHWDPPPRLGYSRETPDIDTVVTALHAVKASDWVREAFASKLESHLQASLHPYQRHWNEIARFVGESGPWRPDSAGCTAADLQMLLALSHRLGANDRANIEAIILVLEGREDSHEGDR